MTTAAKTETEDPTARRILDAALEQFTVFGLRRSSMDDVAKRAGVSRVTVYRRFGTKDALVEQTLLRENSRFFQRLDQAVAALPTMEERVVEGFVVALRHTRAHPLFGGLLRLEPEVVLPYLTVHGGSSLAATVDYLTGHLRRAQQAEGRPGDDPRPVAELMVRVAVSFLLNPASCIEMDDEDQARAFARRYLAPLLNA
ncbi:TetR/AcrR family transcriptional regulator [Streptomyces violaceoruber]|uniref:TetR-family transcriptional regulator n=7 Tax=Streptomyces TaxID=1883 RepID=Q9L240_STRCO|nr:MULTISPECIES: TetR/AcrR family transcriptional regulator [Streptomyces]MYU46296.1 TetR family transcriptional regulator [Streptomyces sp. SID7813]QSJ07438.1 TetR family transcriptional regulator [Streptomyces lividans]AIJ11932.1 TetR family transcriptional regulator [Streptomyces lividans TK24]EFD65272.1 TetR family transcriptional regulator [Streptomyces lividans TK24]EOY51844.1 Transcriptional regulator, TetR family [Streptomyces lividans 1326]